MLPAAFGRTAEDESAPKRERAKLYGNIHSLTSEIQENCRRVGRLLTGVWVLCANYICAVQCAFQGHLHCVEEYLAFCEADVSYEPSLWMRIRRCISRTPRPETWGTKGCICGQTFREGEERCQQYAGLVSSWLRGNGFHVSFDDVTLWKDGTLIWEILKRASGRDERLDALNPVHRKANWSLVGTQIKRWFPGLIQDEVILHCLVTSESLQMHHVIYILVRVMSARKRTQRCWMLKQLIWACDALGSILQPRFTVSGPGIYYANVGIRNEFFVRTPFPCPPFTVETRDASGEVWRENTENARMITRHSHQYTSDSEMSHSDRPVDIIKVSMHLYKIFYIVRAKGNCRIAVMPGINKGGRVFGSPFIVPSVGGSTTRQYPNRMPSYKRSLLYQSLDDRKSSASHDSSGTVKTQEVQESGHATTNGREDENESSKSSRDGAKALKIRRITTGIARQMSSAVSTVSQAIVRRPWKGGSVSRCGDGTERQQTRRTLDTQRTPNAKTLTSGGFAAPSSKRLKIRNVTVHQYLNLAMPSLEEYFLSKDFSVDDTDRPGLVRANKRERSILRMIRDNIAPNGEFSPEKNTSAKRLSLEDSKTRRRIPRLRREDHVLIAPWRRSRHSRDGTVRYGASSRRKSSSSSSESGCDVFDDDVRFWDSSASTDSKESKTSHLNRTVSSQPATPSGGTFHFRDIFHSDGGVADLFLDDDTKLIDEVHNHLRRADNTTKRKLAPSAPAYPTAERLRGRRSGYSTVKQPSIVLDADANSVSSPESVKFSYLDFADKEVDALFKIAIQEYVMCPPVRS